MSVLLLSSEFQKTKCRCSKTKMLSTRSRTFFVACVAIFISMFAFGDASALSLRKMRMAGDDSDSDGLDMFEEELLDEEEDGYGSGVDGEDGEESEEDEAQGPEVEEDHSQLEQKLYEVLGFDEAAIVRGESTLPSRNSNSGERAKKYEDICHGDLHKAYKKAAQKHHPDRHASEPADEQEEHKRMMQAVNAAWEVLGDEEKRKIYDETGEMNGDALKDMTFAEKVDLFKRPFTAVNANSVAEFFEKYRKDESKQLADLMATYRKPKKWKNFYECFLGTDACTDFENGDTMFDEKYVQKWGNMIIQELSRLNELRVERRGQRGVGMKQSSKKRMRGGKGGKGQGGKGKGGKVKMEVDEDVKDEVDEGDAIDAELLKTPTGFEPEDINPEGIFASLRAAGLKHQRKYDLKAEAEEAEELGAKIQKKREAAENRMRLTHGGASGGAGSSSSGNKQGSSTVLSLAAMHATTRLEEGLVGSDDDSVFGGSAGEVADSDAGDSDEDEEEEVYAEVQPKKKQRGNSGAGVASTHPTSGSSAAAAASQRRPGRKQSAPTQKSGGKSERDRASALEREILARNAEREKKIRSGPIFKGDGKAGEKVGSFSGALKVKPGGALAAAIAAAEAKEAAKKSGKKGKKGRD